MESFMPTTSWQTSPSAKYYNCISPNSPGSPVASPSSPTLYQHVAQDDGLFPQVGGLGSPIFKNGSGNNIAAHRSQLATSLLEKLEEYQHLEQFLTQTEFGTDPTDWNEENANLELFNELSALEFTPPAAPHLENQNIAIASVGQSSPGVDIEIVARNENESFDELSAEFQNILDSLPRTATAWGEELIDFTDLIYSSPAETQGYEPTTGTVVEITSMALTDGSGSSEQAQAQEVIDVPDSSTDESEGESEDDIFMETDVTRAASELGTSYQYLSAEETSSMLSMPMSEDEDHSLLVGEKMLDALLVGNLDEAVTFLPGILQPFVGCEDVKPKASKPAKAPRKAANQRRGKKAKTPKIEKIIRKKEQNKTAALRYRMKKKMEVEVTLGLEAQLQAEHDTLQKQKDEVHKEIQMVKQLLRAVFSNRKSKLQIGK